MLVGSAFGFLADTAVRGQAMKSMEDNITTRGELVAELPVRNPSPETPFSHMIGESDASQISPPPLNLLSEDTDNRSISRPSLR